MRPQTDVDDISDPITVDTLARMRRNPVFAGREVQDVEHLDQRSRCTRVRYVDGTSVFVKRATRDAHGRWSADLAHEAAVLRYVAARGLPVPRVMESIAEDSSLMIVMEDLSSHRALDDGRRLAGGRSVPLGHAVGTVLADVHRHTGAAGSAVPDSNLAARFVEGLTVLTPRTVSDFPAGYAELATRVRNGRLVAPLRAAAAQWQRRALIHGDIKSDNILWSGSSAGSGGDLRLIDWELGGLGDPRWDVGCLVGDYLFGWLSTMTFSPDGTLSEWIASADPPLSGVREEIAAALRAYEAGHPTSRDDRRQWMRYAAMFLLQRAHASAIQVPQLSAQCLAFLQVAGRLLRDPDSSLAALT